MLCVCVCVCVRAFVLLNAISLAGGGLISFYGDTKNAELHFSMCVCVCVRVLFAHECSCACVFILALKLLTMKNNILVGDNGEMGAFSAEGEWQSLSQVYHAIAGSFVFSRVCASVRLPPYARVRIFA